MKDFLNKMLHEAHRRRKAIAVAVGTIAAWAALKVFNFDLTMLQRMEIVAAVNFVIVNFVPNKV